MNPQNVLELGQQYSKSELADLLNERNLAKVREGVFSCKNSRSYLLFVDLEKTGKKPRFHFDDYFQEDFFHWDSQTTQHINSPKIQDVVTGRLTTYLFVRVRQKERSKTLPFVFCGRLTFDEHEEATSKPAHLIFQNIDFDDHTENEDLLEIYRWKPSKVGKGTKTKVDKSGQISGRRKKNYKKPNTTERTGLVTSRVGQGYYRQQIIEKWGGKCPLSGIEMPSILIASHIVPWSESTDEERMNVDNGILLSPLYDALFDKHLISFEDDGSLLVSKSINSQKHIMLGMPYQAKILVTHGMKKYLKRHRERLH